MATQNLIQLLASGLRDLDGGVLAGGKVYHYASGTTTKKAVYEDDLAAVESAQPIVLDSRGCAKVYGTGLYDLVVTDAGGATIESFNGLNAGDAPGSLTAAGLLTLIKTVDGATSGLDACLLDGNHASTFLTASTYNAADILSKLLTVDGAGSGVDADKLDGVEGAGYSLADHVHAVDDLSDVTLSSPVSGEALVYDGSKWVNGETSGGVIAISTIDASDVETVHSGAVAYPCFALDLWLDGSFAHFFIELISYSAGGTPTTLGQIQNNHVQDHGVWDSTVGTRHIKFYFK